MKKIIENVNHVGMVGRPIFSIKGEIVFIASAIKQEPVDHQFVQQIHEGLYHRLALI